jgi:hypothetical protein
MAQTAIGYHVAFGLAVRVQFLIRSLWYAA